jgi:hypothetical protein
MTLSTGAGLTGAGLCVAWSPTRPYELAGGDSKGNLLLWDTRRAGVLHAFDQFNAVQDATAAAASTTGLHECASPPWLVHVCMQRRMEPVCRLSPWGRLAVSSGFTVKVDSW